MLPILGNIPAFKKPSRIKSQQPTLGSDPYQRDTVPQSKARVVYADHAEPLEAIGLDEHE